MAIEPDKLRHFKETAKELEGYLAREFFSADSDIALVPANADVDNSPAANLDEPRTPFTTGDIYGRDGRAEIVNLANGVVNGVLSPEKLSVLLSPIQQSQQAQAEEEKQRKERDAEFWLRQMLGDINARIADIDRQLGVLAEERTALREVMDALARGEDVTNEDGTLRNAKAEEPVQNFEKKFGIHIDRNNPADLAKVFKDNEGQDEKLRQDRTGLQQKADKITTQFETANLDEVKAIATEAEARGDSKALDQSIAHVASDEKQIEVAKSLDLNAATEAYATRALLDNDSGRALAGDEELFALGSANKVTKGDAKVAFNKVSPPPVPDDPDNSPSPAGPVRGI
jgi:hypothetical protein